MNQGMLCKPRLFINKKEIQSLKSANFTDGGSNQLQTLNATFSDPDLENVQLFNQLVEYYLNSMGNEDSVPIFRGYVKQINTTDDKMTITANDPRIFLTGKDSFPVSLTENENYDGFTLTQFLFDFIKEKINNNYTLIGTEYMNEIDRPAFLTDIRQDEGVPYDLVQGQINSMYDAENPLEVFGYSIGILHGADSSSIIFIKQKNID